MSETVAHNQNTKRYTRLSKFLKTCCILFAVYHVTRFLVFGSSSFFASFAFCMPLVLIIALAIVFIGLKKHDRMLLFCGVLVIAFLMFDIGGRLLPRNTLSCSPSASTLRMLTHNTGQDLPGYDERNQLILESQADIVLLQEITLQYIEEYWPDLKDMYPYQEYGPLKGDNDELVGLGVLSRYPIYNLENFKLDEEGLMHQQRIEVEVDGNPLALYYIHSTFLFARHRSLEKNPANGHQEKCHLVHC